MPYNNTPITPAKEITGTVSLPLARVKKIIATDDEISNCSNNAAFVITVAAEMFLQHLVEQSYNIVKSGGGESSGRNAGKPRRNIQYRDVANAVARVENLEFLTDVVPKTTTYRTFKQRQNATATVNPNPTLQPPPPQQQPQPQPNGQSTLDTHMSAAGVGVGVGMAEPEQATNGASRLSPGAQLTGHVPISPTPVEAMEVDVVDVDDEGEEDGMEGEERDDEDEEGSMHTANDEPERDGEMEPEPEPEPEPREVGEVVGMDVE